MNKSILATIVLLIVLVLCSCTANTEPENNFEPEPEGGLPEISVDVDQDEPETSGGYSIIYPEKFMFFDFAEFPEEYFLRGVWTVDLLIEKYGELKETEVLKDLFGTGDIFIGLMFDLYSVLLTDPDIEKFSFTRESIVAGESVLDENDKNLELEIRQFNVSDANIQLPHDLQIGKSTKKDILDAYPDGTAMIYINEETGSDSISFYYTFSDENGDLPEWGKAAIIGGVSYNFDENEILTHVDIIYNY